MAGAVIHSTGKVVVVVRIWLEHIKEGLPRSQCSQIGKLSSDWSDKLSGTGASFPRLRSRFNQTSSATAQFKVAIKLSLCVRCWWWCFCAPIDHFTYHAFSPGKYIKPAYMRPSVIRAHEAFGSNSCMLENCSHAWLCSYSALSKTYISTASIHAFSLQRFLPWGKKRVLTCDNL